MWFPNRSDTNWAVQAQKILETANLGFRKYRNYTICVAKSKALISFAVTAKLICTFVFAYTDCRFSHEAAHLYRRLMSRYADLFKTTTFLES